MLLLSAIPPSGRESMNVNFAMDDSGLMSINDGEKISITSIHWHNFTLSTEKAKKLLSLLTVIEEQPIMISFDREIERLEIKEIII